MTNPLKQGCPSNRNVEKSFAAHVGQRLHALLTLFTYFIHFEQEFIRTIKYATPYVGVCRSRISSASSMAHNHSLFRPLSSHHWTCTFSLTPEAWSLDWHFRLGLLFACTCSSIYSVRRSVCPKRKKKTFILKCWAEWLIDLCDNHCWNRSMPAQQHMKYSCPGANVADWSMP